MKRIELVLILELEHEEDCNGFSFRGEALACLASRASRA